MKPLFILSVFLFITPLSFSQSLKKYPIGDSGCSIYIFCDPKTFDKTYSEDSSIVYTGECKANSLDYGIICVKLKAPIIAGNDAEELMISYLDYLKTTFNINDAVGYGKGHIMNGKPDAQGVIDYWKDKDGDEWKIKAWTDGKIIGMLYIVAKGKLNETEKNNVFLNSFRFPGM